MRLEIEKKTKEDQKISLEKENLVLKDHMTSLLEMIKQEECYIQNLKQKELLLQKSIEDIMGFMSICDWTLQHDLSRSKSLLPEKINPTLKALIERDTPKIDQARKNFKESLLSMKKIFERTEDVELF